MPVGATVLNVAEVFGPTLQGEGPSAGRRAVFIRTSGCNLDCAWCDTPFTWDWSGKNGTVFDPSRERYRAGVDGLVAQVARLFDGIRGTLVITGGEPLVQRRAVLDLARRGIEAGWAVEVETNGTVGPYPRGEGDKTAEVIARNIAEHIGWNVSPKLAHSGIAVERRLRPDVLREFVKMPDARFKFVASTPGHIDEVAAIVAEAHIDPTQVWLMPEGGDAASVVAGTRLLAPLAAERGWNLSTRLHVLAWGNERGH